LRPEVFGLNVSSIVGRRLIGFLTLIQASEGHRPLGDNLGYHAFRDKEQAEHDASWHGWYPAVIGSVAMWGEVIEHQCGWRSEYAAVRSIIRITGDIPFSSKHWLLQELREKYCCKVVTEL
jgi:hypothetical protein